MKVQRQQKIIQLIKKHGSVRVTQLASQLQVTPETIRTDLNDLSCKGIIKRCHGGAVIDCANLDDIAQDEIIQYLTSENWEIKCDTTNEQTVCDVCILGSFNVDMIGYLSKFPAPGETMFTDEFIFSPGGKGCNQALAATFAGANTHFITKVGTDQFSQYAIDFISTSQIKSSTIYQSDKYPTGAASIFVERENGENMIAVSSGANINISVEEVRLQKDKIREAKIILLQLETNQEALNEMITMGKEFQIPIILNPAPYNEFVHELLPKIDYLTPNQSEASQITGINVIDDISAQKAAEMIYRKGVKNVIITLGKKGSIAFDGQTFIFSPPYPAVVKNTVGAGDAFNGALAAALAQGGTLKYALNYASAFASLAVETNNASEMPVKDAVMNRIAQTNYSQRVKKAA